MPIDAGKIKEYRSGIASKVLQEREATLKYIAKLHPQETIPVIISIIGDGIPLLKEKGGTEEAIHFLNYTHELLQDIHRKQNATVTQLPSILKEFTKERITAELEALIKKAELLQVSAETLLLWKEAEIWLEGWYRHTADDKNLKRDKSGIPIKDKKSGMYSSIDMEDSLFQKIVGLSKLQVAEYYGKVAEIIRGKITLFNEQLLNAKIQQEKKELPAVASSSSTLSLSVNQASNLVKQDAKLEVHQHDGFTTISISISSLDNAMIQSVLDAMKMATVSQPAVTTVALPVPAAYQKEPVTESGLSSMLTSVMEDDEQIQIQVLEFAVKELGLTDNQKRMLGKLNEEIVANLDNYTNASYVIPFTRVPLPVFCSRTHAQLAAEKKAEISRAADPVDLLKILFDMRTTLIGVCSDELLGKVNKLLLDTFTKLRKVPQLIKIMSIAVV